VALSTCAAIVFGGFALSLPGCGGEAEVTQIEQEKPLTEQMKGSIEYMQQKYAKKGSKSR